jgi:hypothetical protein
MDDARDGFLGVSQWLGTLPFTIMGMQKRENLIYNSAHYFSVSLLWCGVTKLVTSTL